MVLALPPLRIVNTVVHVTQSRRQKAGSTSHGDKMPQSDHSIVLQLAQPASSGSTDDHAQHLQSK